MVLGKKKPEASTSRQPLDVGGLLPLSEILEASNNFDQSLVIGKGGNGTVYKGKLSNGINVAIKRLGVDDEVGFRSEIDALSSVSHENILGLVGYYDHKEVKTEPEPKAKAKSTLKLFSPLCCMGCPSTHPPTTNKKEKILVYPFMSKGTLKDLLHHQHAPISFVDRLDICIAIAEGLLYLHCVCITVHRDIKSENILFDENGIAKIGDFGLARILTNGSPVKSNTDREGTFGYMDVRYFVDNMLTRAIDVYCFGVVLLEIICRKRILDESRVAAQHSLVQFFRERTNNNILQDVTDPEIQNEISPRFIDRFYEIVAICLRTENRPRIIEVLCKLQELQRDFKRFMHSSLGEISEEGPSTPQNPGLKTFTYKELELATNGFSENLCMGEHPDVQVFKGWVDMNTLCPSNHVSGTPIAVKRVTQPERRIEMPEEAQIFGVINHSNIIRILGWCTSEEHQYVVYEYIKKSLPQTIQQVPWSKRLQILTGVVSALAYLHTQKGISTHFQSYGILLDEEFNAKIVAFRWVNYEHRDMIWVRGVAGYIDGGYDTHGAICLLRDNDVHSFGKLTLEIMIGGSLSPKDLKGLVKRLERVVNADVKQQGKLLKNVMDPSLNDNYSEEDALKCLRLGLQCVAKQTTNRPSREDIMGILGDIAPS